MFGTHTEVLQNHTECYYYSAFTEQLTESEPILNEEALSTSHVSQFRTVIVEHHVDVDQILLHTCVHTHAHTQVEVLVGSKGGSYSATSAPNTDDHAECMKMLDVQEWTTIQVQSQMRKYTQIFSNGSLMAACLGEGGGGGWWWEEHED